MLRTLLTVQAVACAYAAARADREWLATLPDDKRAEIVERRRVRAQADLEERRHQEMVAAVSGRSRRVNPLLAFLAGFVIGDL